MKIRNKIIIIFFIIAIFQSGCTKQYYENIKEINIAIAQSNEKIAIMCSQALNSAKGDSGVIVAIALTTCQGQQEFLKVEAPEKIGDIIKSIIIGSIPWAFVEVARGGKSINYEVGGDMIQNGSGTAGTNRNWSTTEIVAEGE